jgi:hypothetical protein
LSTLQLPWLEKRNYLHGTTLLEAMRQYVPEDAALFLRIPKMLETDCIRIVNLDAGTRPPTDKASLTWHATSSQGAVFAEPRPPTAIPRRETYDEGVIERAVEASVRHVRFVGDSPFSLVATLVPMMKALLTREVSPSVPGRWLFVRFEIDQYPAKFSEVELSLDAVLRKGRLARGRFSADRLRSGAIDFAWI